MSLGLPAVFLWGGSARSDRPMRVPLVHGDVVVAVWYNDHIEAWGPPLLSYAFHTAFVDCGAKLRYQMADVDVPGTSRSEWVFRVVLSSGVRF